MSSNTSENQESEDLILSFLNQDCFADTDASLSDPKLLANDDNLWDFLNNVPTVDKESISGGASPPWSSSSSDDNGGLHELPSSPHSSKGGSPGLTSPKLEEPEADYWQYVNEECVLENAASSSSSSKNSLTSTPLSIDDLSLKLQTQHQTVPFLQGVPLPKHLGGQAPLFYPHGLAGLPAFPLFATPIPIMSPAQPTPEPPKKKRGRKKREPCPAPSTANLVPLKPLIPVSSQTSVPLGFAETKQEVCLPSSNDVVVVKREVTEIPLQNLPTDNPKPAIVSPKSGNQSVHVTPNKITTPPTEAAVAALSKRQERLIKNRAAALLSRKRKREHMANLETTNETLVQENDELRIKVEELEDQMSIISDERDKALEECLKLRRMLEEVGISKEQPASKDSPSDTAIEIETMDIDLESNYIVESEADEVIKFEDKRLSKPKTTGVVLMIIFFSFALFSLPMTNYQSTIGGNYGSRATMGSNLFSPSSHVNSATTPRVVDVENVRDSTKGKGKSVKRSLPVEEDNLKCQMNRTELPRSASGEEATRAIHSWLSLGPASDKQRVKPAFPSKPENKEQVSMAVTTFRKNQHNVLPLVEHAYLYCDNLQHFFAKHNETDQKTLNQRPRISLLSPVGGVFPPPWAAGPKDRKYLRIDLEVTGSGLVDTEDSWMFQGLKRASTYGGTING
ncbi:hypothetical protein K7432_004043 [Basidiobolus ranarum]|uniref:BZIP domain-containing protein n=1 Tax=Basidiobolus ranarum TaxID=34480 RepID=A0ABR2W5Q7_9FUNG